MRASATSRIASAASYAASQSKANANQADPASPFALLVDTVAPKDGTKDAKSSQKDNSQDVSDADDKSAVQQDSGSQQDTNAAQAASQPAGKSTAPASGKSGKSGDSKDDTANKADDEEADDRQVAATALQLLSLQNLPPPPPSQTQAAIPAAVPTSDDDLTVDAPAPASQSAPSADIQSNTPPVAPSATPASAPAPVAAQDDQQDDDAVIAADVQVAAPPSGTQQPDIKPAQSGKTVAKPVAAAAKPANTAAPQPAAGDTAEDEITQLAAETPRTSAPAKPSTGKNDNVKTAALKTDSAKNRFAQDIKTDPKADADKIAQIAASQAEVDEISDTPAPKPAPQPVQGLNNNPLINPNTPAGTVPANPIAVAQVTQHIQVTATPAPNLPALAVEIAAKSQSGVKQFDIRLDPPELGRVEVRLSIDATGKASAHLSADQLQTLTLLQKDAPVLTRALREAGLDVSQDGLNFSLRQQSDNNQSGNAGNSNRRGSSRSFSLSATTGVDATAMTAAYRGPANGRLDIRV